MEPPAAVPIRTMRLDTPGIHPPLEFQRREKVDVHEFRRAAGQPAGFRRRMVVGCEQDEFQFCCRANGERCEIKTASAAALFAEDNAGRKTRASVTLRLTLWSRINLREGGFSAMISSMTLEMSIYRVSILVARLAQWKSTSFTRKGSQVQVLQRAPSRRNPAENSVLAEVLGNAPLRRLHSHVAFPPIHRAHFAVFLHELKG